MSPEFYVIIYYLILFVYLSIIVLCVACIMNQFYNI